MIVPDNTIYSCLVLKVENFSQMVILGCIIAQSLVTSVF